MVTQHFFLSGRSPPDPSYVMLRGPIRILDHERGLKISIAEKVVVRTRRAGKIIQKAAFYHFKMKAYFLLKISQRMRYVRLVVQTFQEVPFRKSCFSFASIKRFTRICDTSDRKLPEGVQRSSNITDKEMLTRPSF